MNINLTDFFGDTSHLLYKTDNQGFFETTISFNQCYIKNIFDIIKTEYKEAVQKKILQLKNNSNSLIYIRVELINECHYQLYIKNQETILNWYFEDISFINRQKKQVIKQNKESSFLLDAINSQVCYVNSNLKITYINKPFGDFFGLARRQTIGKPIKDVFPKLIGKKFLNGIKTTLETKYQLITEEQLYNAKYRKRTVIITYLPKTTENNTISSIIITIKDITAQKKTENRLQRNLKQQNLLTFISYTLNSLDDFNNRISKVFDYLGKHTEVSRIYILINDAKKRHMFRQFEWCNHEINNSNEENLYLKNKAYIVLLEHIKEQSYLYTRNTRKDLPIELIPFFKKQSVMTLLLVPIYIQDELFGCIGYDECYKIRTWSKIEIELLQTVTNMLAHAFHRKITMKNLQQNEQKLLVAKNKAEESDKLKTIFLSNVSHEIRTPINGMVAFAKLLEKETLTKKETKEYAKIINSNAALLLQLINDILDFTRIEANKLIIVKKEIHTYDLLNHLYHFFKSEIATKGKGDINLKMIAKPNHIIISDPIRLQQILSNLINNAIKFTKKGFIEFGYNVTNNETIFYVTDTGIGISREKIADIFERFEQINGENKSGTGLGLAITKGLVKLLDGKIWVDSMPDKGSTFYVLLPNKNLSKNTKANIKTIHKTTINLAGKTILIAEDDSLSYHYISMLLTESKANLIHTKNGIEAVEIAQTQEIDLILMDIYMPKLNGLKAIKLIRKKNLNIPIIAQSTHALEADKQKSFEAGCDSFISKPIDSDELFELISMYLE